MAEKLTPEELAAIRGRHFEIETCLSCDEPMSDQFVLIHKDRAALLRHVEALEQEVERLQKHINNQSHRHQQAMNRRLLLHREAERKLARLVELLSAERKALKDVERFGGYGFDEVYLDAKRDTDYMLEALTNTANGDGK